MADPLDRRICPGCGRAATRAWSCRECGYEAPGEGFARLRDLLDPANGDGPDANDVQLGAFSRAVARAGVDRVHAGQLEQAVPPRARGHGTVPEVLAGEEGAVMTTALEALGRRTPGRRRPSATAALDPADLVRRWPAGEGR